MYTRFNVDTLLRKLAAQKNIDFDKTTVAELSGISRTTITAITNNKSKRIDLETIDNLLTFFEAQGMPITVGDLFVTTTQSR
jgi:DNA-binding Xre family transcriptional regulator